MKALRHYYESRTLGIDTKCTFLGALVLAASYSESSIYSTCVVTESPRA